MVCGKKWAEKMSTYSSYRSYMQPIVIQELCGELSTVTFLAQTKVAEFIDNLPACRGGENSNLITFCPRSFDVKQA